MILTLLPGYPDYIGRRQAIAGAGAGPASYVQYASGGDPISYARFNSHIDSLNPAMTVSTTYIVYPVPNAAVKRANWTAKWIVAATGAEVAAATNLSGETLILSGYAGQY